LALIEYLIIGSTRKALRKNNLLSANKFVRFVT
jgi:hypothetical protein